MVPLKTITPSIPIWAVTGCVASMSRFKSVEPVSTVRLGVALAVGVTARGTGVNGGAVAAIVGMLVGLVPGADVGAAVGVRRVGVAVGFAAMDNASGATRVKEKSPHASSPETMAIDIKMIEERGTCDKLIGQPERERAMGTNSGCTASGGTAASSTRVFGAGISGLGAGGSGIGLIRSGLRAGCIGFGAGGSNRSGGGRVSGGGGGREEAGSLPVGKTGFFGFGEGGARGNRLRSRAKGSDAGRTVGSGTEAGSRVGLAGAGFGSSSLGGIGFGERESNIGGGGFSSGGRIRGGTIGALGGRELIGGSTFSGRTAAVCDVAIGLGRE